MGRGVPPREVSAVRRYRTDGCHGLVTFLVLIYTRRQVVRHESSDRSRAVPQRAPFPAPLIVAFFKQRRL